MKKCIHEIWKNSDRTIVLCPDPKRDWYLKYYDNTHWIAGIDYYWLIQNGFKKIGFRND